MNWNDLKKLDGLKLEQLWNSWIGITWDLMYRNHLGLEKLELLWIRWIGKNLKNRNSIRLHVKKNHLSSPQIYTKILSPDSFNRRTFSWRYVCSGKCHRTLSNRDFLTNLLLFRNSNPAALGLQSAMIITAPFRPFIKGNWSKFGISWLFTELSDSVLALNAHLNSQIYGSATII
jgi:hypothetical protein